MLTNESFLPQKRSIMSHFVSEYPTIHGTKGVTCHVALATASLFAKSSQTMTLL